MTIVSQFAKVIALSTLAAAGIGCAKKADGKSSESAIGAPARYLYVSSGLCQAGANTTFTTTTSSNVVYRINADTGARDITLVDYNTTPGESPVGVVNYDDGYVLVAIEKSGARRIEKVSKSYNGTRTNFSTDTAALANTLLSMTRRPDGSVMISRTNGVAQIATNGATQFASYLGASSGTAACGTTNTKYSSLVSTAMGHVLYLNSEANDNKVSIVKFGPTCLSGRDVTNAAAVMTAGVYVPGAGQVIVGVANNTIAADQNALLVYGVSEDASTATLSATPTKIYDISMYPSTYPFQLYAVSAMAYDPAGGFLYVATANTAAANIATAGNYQIEKFSYNATTKTLARVGSVPFYASGVDTKCISSMFVGN